jgi:hypothetical protein
LCEGQIAEFVEHCEVEPGQVVGDASLLSGAVLGLEPVDEIDDVEEAPASSITDERSGNRDCQVRLARAGTADEDGVALIGNEGTGSEVADQCLVDGRIGEVEVFDVLGQRQLGDGELVLDGAGLLLCDLGREPSLASISTQSKYLPVVAISSARRLRSSAGVKDHLYSTGWTAQRRAFGLVPAYLILNSPKVATGVVIIRSLPVPIIGKGSAWKSRSALSPSHWSTKAMRPSYTAAVAAPQLH